MAASDLDKTSSTGDGTIYYPSGNIAVIVCKQASGQIITFFSDNKSSQIIASFNAKGVGFVYFPTGKPWYAMFETFTVAILNAVAVKLSFTWIVHCMILPSRVRSLCNLLTHLIVPVTATCAPAGSTATVFTQNTLA